MWLNDPRVNALGSLYVSGSGQVYLQYSCSLSVYGWLDLDWSSAFYLYDNANLTLDSGSNSTVQGYLAVEYNSYAYFRGAVEVPNGGSIWVSNSSSLYLEYGGVLNLHGEVTLDDYAYSNVYDNGRVIIYADGSFYVQNYAGYSVDWNGTVEVFGRFSVAPESYLNVNYAGLMRVYREFYLSGQLSGGGRIDMMPREARIYDYSGNPLIYFDHAYGFGQTLVG